MRVWKTKLLIQFMALCMGMTLLAGCEKKEKQPETGTETVETTSVQSETSVPDRHSLYEGNTNYFYDQLSIEQKVFFNILKKQAEAFYWGTEEPKTRMSSTIRYPEGSYGLGKEITQGYFGNLELGPLSVYEAEAVAQLFYHSYPKYFFFSGMLVVDEDNKCYMDLVDGFTSREVIDSYRDKIEAKTQEWMKVIDKCGNDLEKEEAILQLICDNVEYNMSSRNNLYRYGITCGLGGALGDGIATDHGYAKTFQYLCNAAGLDSLYVWSSFTNFHAWNMVKLYDEWYCIDVSWLDVDKMDSPANQYFNKSYNSFRNHDSDDRQMINGKYVQYGVQMPMCIRDVVKDGPQLYSDRDEGGLYVIKHGMLTEYRGEGSEFLYAEDGVLFDADKNTLMRYPNAGASEYDVPEGTKIIAKFAFINCATLETLRLPASLTEIRAGAFMGCSTLKEIYFEGTKDQWDAIEAFYPYFPGNCTIHFQ